MKCPHCGAEIPDNSKFCLNCGKQVEQANVSSDVEETVEDDLNDSTQEKVESTSSQDSQQADSSEIAPSSVYTSETEPSLSEVDATVEKDALNQSADDSDTVAEDKPLETQDDTDDENGGKPDAPVSEESITDESPSKVAKGVKIPSLKGKHPAWLLVLLCLFVPPVGIALLWKWKKPKSEAGKIVLTVILSLLTVCYALTIIGAVINYGEESQELASLTTLDSTYTGRGVKLSYPSSWEKYDDEVGGIFPHTEAAYGLMFYTPSDLGRDTSDYNLNYKTGFDDYVEDVISTINRTKGFVADDSGESTTVLRNAMYRKFRCRVVFSDDETANGTMILYVDASGHVYGLYFFEDEGIGNGKGQADKVLKNVMSTIRFTSEDYDHDPSKNPTKSLVATYSGDTNEGTTLDDSNSGIKVTATYADGTTKELGNSGWHISNPQTLKAGQTSTVTIETSDATTNLSVKCTTMTEDQYKQSCQSISYDELLRNPDNYKGKNIKLRGKVFQSVDGTLLMYVTQGSYGIWDDITMVAWKGEPNVIEDDIITVWGPYTGTYTYTTALGADKTVPLVDAKYVSIE